MLGRLFRRKSPRCTETKYFSTDFLDGGQKGERTIGSHDGAAPRTGGTESIEARKLQPRSGYQETAERNHSGDEATRGGKAARVTVRTDSHRRWLLHIPSPTRALNDYGLSLPAVFDGVGDTAWSGL